MKKDEIWQAVCELKSLNEKRNSKYLRNYRSYWYTPWASLKNIRDPSLVGYFQKDDSWEDDTTATPQLNIIKSVIDTLTSKIAQSKVRPFFNTMVQKNSYSLGETLTPMGVAFYIAPYINATVRMGTYDEKMTLFESMLDFRAYEKVPSTKRGCKG